MQGLCACEACAMHEVKDGSAAPKSERGREFS